MVPWLDRLSELSGGTGCQSRPSVSVLLAGFVGGGTG